MGIESEPVGHRVDEFDEFDDFDDFDGRNGLMNESFHHFDWLFH